MQNAFRRGLWLFWGLLAVLAVTAPFNPAINQPAILFPFFLVSGVLGLVAISVAIRLEYGRRER